MVENTQEPYTTPRNSVALLNNDGLEGLIATYRDGLLHDTLPFWMKYSIDREQGGFLFSLDRDGSVIDTDKGMWQHGRFTWLLATLYQEVEPRDDWLALAKHGIDFIRNHGFDSDGRMFFQVTRDGRPLRKRRYLFTETFGAIALAAYAKAAGDDRARREAVDLFDLIIRYLTTPGLMSSKFTDVRPAKGLGIPMILTATAQVMRDCVGDRPLYTEWIDRSIEEIERDFLNHEFEAVMETVGPNGEFIDHFDGRTITPGHAIEAAWFTLMEAKRRNKDAQLIELGTTILDWSWAQGWDETYGGILYFRDVKGWPVQEYWQDMKFWWPQNEAIIATLLAYQLTGDEKYARWHQMIHEWTYAHFPDPDYGEWFGYLHRDGRVSVPLKGNLWKGPFHMPRMQLVCWQILTEMSQSL